MSNPIPTPGDLNSVFGIDSGLSFHEHSSGLIYGKVKTERCTGAFFLQGAHVTDFQPAHTTRPVLFMSNSAVYAKGRALRGGIPICFPWFGSHATDTQRPAHGWARISPWSVSQTRWQSGDIEIVLTLQEFPFSMEYRLVFGKEMKAAFVAKNISDDSIHFEVALHTYFSIGAIRSIAIEGALASIPYLDQLTGTNQPATDQPIRFTEETDRIYQGTATEIRLRDPYWNRTVSIHSKNSGSTVVWNPWIAKSQRLADFGDDEYLRMCCIETANVRENRVTIGAGESQATELVLSVETVKCVECSKPHRSRKRQN
jgi:D-hexose-6-phosphate mutarotase